MNGKLRKKIMGFAFKGLNKCSRQINSLSSSPRSTSFTENTNL